jgi:hypothetical protein
MGMSLYLDLASIVHCIRTNADDRCVKRRADAHEQEQHQEKKAIRTGQSSI